MKNIALRLVIVLMPLLLLAASQHAEATNYSLELCKMRCRRNCIKFEINCLDETSLPISKCADLGDRCEDGCMGYCEVLWK